MHLHTFGAACIVPGAGGCDGSFVPKALKAPWLNAVGCQGMPGTGLVLAASCETISDTRVMRAVVKEFLHAPALSLEATCICHATHDL